MLSDFVFFVLIVFIFVYLGKSFFMMPTFLKTFPLLLFAFSVLNSFIKTFNKLETFTGTFFFPIRV